MNGIKHPRDWILIGRCVNNGMNTPLYLYFTGAEITGDKVWPGVWLGTEGEREKLILTNSPFDKEIIRSICARKDAKVTDDQFVDYFRRANKNMLASE